MLLTICCAVRCGVTSALSVQSWSTSVFLLKKFKLILSNKQKKATCQHLRSLVLEDQDSPVLDDKLDVWPGGAAGGLPDALKLGDGDVELGQETLLDDEVDVVNEIKRPSALDVALGGEVVAGLRFDGIELDLQRVLESRGLQMLKGVWVEGDESLWGVGVAGGMSAGAHGLVGTSS